MSTKGILSLITLCSIVDSMPTHRYDCGDPSPTSRSGNRRKKYKTNTIVVGIRKEPKIGRNEICPACDSGLKYKKCCINKPENEKDEV